MRSRAKVGRFFVVGVGRVGVERWKSGQGSGARLDVFPVPASQTIVEAPSDVLFGWERHSEHERLRLKQHQAKEGAHCTLQQHQRERKIDAAWQSKVVCCDGLRDDEGDEEAVPAALYCPWQRIPA